MPQHTSNRDLLLDKLIELAGHTAIVHHIPGRIRLKVKLAGLLLAQDLEVADLADHFKGILETRANMAARSIVIVYDTGTIAPGLWEQLVNGKKDPSVQDSVRKELERLFPVSKSS